MKYLLTPLFGKQIINVAGGVGGYSQFYQTPASTGGSAFGIFGANSSLSVTNNNVTTIKGGNGGNGAVSGGYGGQGGDAYGLLEVWNYGGLGSNQGNTFTGVIAGTGGVPYGATTGFTPVAGSVGAAGVAANLSLLGPYPGMNCPFCHAMRLTAVFPDISVTGVQIDYVAQVARVTFTGGIPPFAYQWSIFAPPKLIQIGTDPTLSTAGWHGNFAVYVYNPIIGSGVTTFFSIGMSEGRKCW